MTNRRQFLRQSIALLAIPSQFARARELECEIAVIGGGVGGYAAALAALRNGRRVILTEETRWIGGQLTSQAVPPDEHPWIEQFDFLDRSIVLQLVPPSGAFPLSLELVTSLDYWPS